MKNHRALIYLTIGLLTCVTSPLAVGNPFYPVTSSWNKIFTSAAKQTTNGKEVIAEQAFPMGRQEWSCGEKMLLLPIKGQVGGFSVYSQAQQYDEPGFEKDRVFRVLPPTYTYTMVFSTGNTRYYVSPTLKSTLERNLGGGWKDSPELKKALQDIQCS